MQTSLYLFNTHAEADKAIRSLLESGFDGRKLALIDTGYHNEELPVGFCTIGDRIRAWGVTGLLWGAVSGLLIEISRPVASALLGALEGAAVVGGISALCAAVTAIGNPKNKVIKYETAVKVNEYVLIVHGGTEEEAKARSVLAKPTATLTTV